MLYSTLENDFGSKEGSWKRERIWMLKFLADGMRGSIDWAVLQRRHTWDLLATMFQANRHDRTVILRVTKVRTFTISTKVMRFLIIKTIGPYEAIKKYSCGYELDRT